MAASNTIRSSLYFAVFVLALSLYSTKAWVAEPTDGIWLEAAKNMLETQKIVLKANSADGLDSDELASIMETIQPIRLRAQDCIVDVEGTLQRRQEDLASLGPRHPREEADVTRARSDLERQRDTLAKTLATCRYVAIQAKDLKETITAIEQASLARRLFIEGPSIWLVVSENLRQSETWWLVGYRFLSEQSGFQLLNWPNLVTTLGIVLLGFWGGRRLARAILAREQNVCVDRCTNFLLAFRTCSTAALPLIAAAGGVVGYLCIALPLEPVPFITAASWGFILYVLMVAVVNTIFRPVPPATFYLPLDTALAHAVGKRLKALLAVGLIGYLLFGTAFSSILPESQYLIVRAVYGTFFIINLAWIIWLVGDLPGMVGIKGVRFLLAAFLLLILGAEWLGYRNLATFGLIGLLGTLIGFGVTWFVSTLMTDLFDGLDGGYQHWQKQLRLRMGLKSDDRVPGLIWVRLLVGVALWGGTGLWTLWVWGLSHRGLEIIIATLREGFEIGTFHVVPIQIALAAITFSLLFAISGWFKGTGVPRWLRNTRLDRGARDALITVTGYAGLSVSVLVALSMAGVEFTNLAIIAGALSVGIGFGLQNVVNNFVSGLILLFERPIRTGDWIVVGATEGYVRKISTRSTRIETFDRADVIVPNSELISSQVTNWMLHDSWGRVIVPVEVAYGTNTGKVRDILIAVAHAHELVVTDSSRVSPPTVLIRGFGDSALKFELRCFIKLVDKRIQTISDLYFAIDAAFREEGVEIPFPQRDLHIKDWPDRMSEDA